MTIEVTDEMIYAFAGEPEITATDAHAIEVGLKSVLAIIDRDYVTRWGEVKISVPAELTITPKLLKYLKDTAADQAKYMGATVVDIDNPKVDWVEYSFINMNQYIWRIRRD